MKVTLDEAHREDMEKMASQTKLSFNQIANLVWVRSKEIREDIVRCHTGVNPAKK